MSSVPIGTLDEAMQTFSKKLAEAQAKGGDLAKILKLNDVKVSGDTLKDLESYARLVEHSTSAQQRNLLITTAFGKSNQELGRIFDDLNRTMAEADRAGAVHSDEQVQRARELNDEMTRLRPQLEAAQTDFALLVVPAEIELLSTFNEGIRQTRDILTDITTLNFGSFFQHFSELGTALSGGPGGFIAYMQAAAVTRKAVAEIKINGGKTEGAGFGSGWGAQAFSTKTGGAGDNAAAAALKASEKAYQSLITTTDKHIRALKDEKDALTDAGLAADTARGYLDLLNQAQASGAKLGPDRIAKLHEEAAALAAAQEALAGGKLNQSDRSP